MKPSISASIFLLFMSAVNFAQAAENYDQLKIEVVSKNEDLMIFVVNDSAEDIEIFYPFSLSFDGGGPGDLELIFRPVGRSPEPPEGRLCAAIQPSASAIPKSRMLWAGALFGQHFDISYIKDFFCLKNGTYDVFVTLYINGNRKIDFSPTTTTRLVIKQE